ncbi:MAG TPA: cbb3-type cytochrome oxidase assembly protein CcoS [Verrucomicrobiae bacterium]|jgi:cbb3-type cytochrome oxidase maturation protein|nr:cbb3-type cytochrome oxidase assembly protein CcoS [Verrucomicrobiae bacterium]
MIILLFLIPLSIALAVVFLAAFIWAVRSGQYEDTSPPALRALLEEPNAAKAPRPIVQPPQP